MMNTKFLQSDGLTAALRSLPRKTNTPLVLGEKLGGLKRFQGHPRAYTVLEHTLAMALVAERKNLGDAVVAACLTHDLAEAYTGDVNGRIKSGVSGLSEIDFAIRAGLEGVGWYIIDSPAVMDIVHALDVDSVLAECSLMWSGPLVTNFGPYFYELRDRLSWTSGSLYHNANCYMRMCQHYGAFQ